ncbi:MAG: PadR family transcriptional regulator [Gemmatimonadota bacterium]|nr:PadR family transcriptional regulator [Gemmatimonadota bacterium]
MSLIRSDLLRGTLDLLILKTLTLEPMHGWGVAQRIRQLSDEVFDVNQGSMYPALRRLQRKGWVTSEWRVTDNNRRARYYTLTPLGRRQLADEEEQWELSSAAVDRVLKLALQGG